MAFPLLDERSRAVVGILLRKSDPLLRTEGTDEWRTASSIADDLRGQLDRTALFRTLQRLVDERALEAAGATRSRRYRAASGSRAILEWQLTQPRELRPSVGYDPELLESSAPNKTSWLGPQRLERLHDAADFTFVVDSKAYSGVMNSLLIDLSYASSRLEDVHITWLDTKTLVDFGERPDGLTDREYRIVLNHKEAIQYLVEGRGQLNMARRTVFDVHKLLTGGLLGNPADDGRVRRGLVYFVESAYQPLANPFQLKEEFNAFCDKAREIEDPFEQSVFAMVFLPYIQPFQDANKRTSRLCMNIPLLERSLPPFSFTQMNRRDYMLGLLAFHEQGKHEFLVDAFEAAYLKSAPKYTELLHAVNAGGTLSTLDSGPIRKRHSPR